MNDHNWFEWLLGGIVAILGFFGKRLQDKVDNSVTREELTEMLDDFRAERREMHDQNRQTLDRIHTRVDQLYQQRFER